MESIDSKGQLQYSSILVPSVQEMVQKNRTEAVLSRYLRPDQDKVIVEDSGPKLLEIPIIDMNVLISEESTGSELNKLDSACRDWGFFQLINHGVDSSFVEKVKAEVYQFFNLPMEEKKKLWQKKDEIEGFGQAFVVSEEQKLDWADLFFLGTQPIGSRKPHLFPNLPPPFRDTVEAYSAEVMSIAKTLVAKMGTALKVNEEELIGLFEDGIQTLRMNYYPPCPQPEQVIGLTPHSDAVGLTVLLQVNEMEGLQIKKDGKWVPVKPLPNAFIINVGDILEMLTNGEYRSIEHRAIVNSEKERLSVAAFHSPRINAELRPAKSLVSEETPAMFRSVTTAEFFKHLFSRELDGKALLDAFRI